MWIYVAAACCTLCEALFTTLEVALGTLSRARLRALAEGDDGRDDATLGQGIESCRAARVLSLLEQPDRLAMVFITVTSLCLWSVATLLCWQACAEGWSPWVLPAALLGVLFVAEVLPLLVAARAPEPVALRCAPVVLVGFGLLRPLIALLGAAARVVARLGGAGSGSDLAPQVTAGELRTALASAVEHGVIESNERALLEGAMDFREKQVREVMVRRIDIVGAPAEASLHDALRLAIQGGHTRLPIYDGSIDKIVGVLSTKDLIPHLRAPRQGPPRQVRDLLRPAFFVPATKRIEPTLEELRRQRTLMAIVVDADGGTAGLVTVEDLLEEIVGEIQDEYDQEEPALRLVPLPATGPGDGPSRAGAVESAVRCDGDVTVRELERFWRDSFDLEPLFEDAGGPADPALSLSGLAMGRFEDVPRIGDHTVVGRAPGDNALLYLSVEAMDGPRIKTVKVWQSNGGGDGPT